MSVAISMLSLLVAGLTALYARWSAAEARKQNDVSIHGDRIKIYRGIAKFGQMLVTKGEHLTEDDVREFDGWVELSEFYFKAQIHRQLDSINHDVNGVIDMQAEWKKVPVRSEEKSELKRKIRGLLAELRDKHKAVYEEVKSTLRIAQPPNWIA